MQDNLLITLNLLIAPLCFSSNLCVHILKRVGIVRASTLNWGLNVFEVLCLVCVCARGRVHARSIRWYPKVVYVLHKVIGLLNSSNATAAAETPECYFMPPQQPRCSALHPLLSFQLSPRHSQWRPCRFAPNYPEALTCRCGGLEESNSSSSWPISAVGKEQENLSPRPRADCIRLDSTRRCARGKRVSGGGAARHVGQGRRWFRATSSRSYFHLIDLEEREEGGGRKCTIYVQIGICVRFTHSVWGQGNTHG